MVALLLLLITFLVVSGRGQQLANEKADLDTLRFVHAIWRHGDRSPSKMMPTDEQSQQQKWTDRFGGPSQLTPRGALQHFQLGQLLRNRYAGFLSDQFDPGEFVYRCSAYNRTQMSAMANVQGMFAALGQTSPKVPLTENAPAHLHLHFRPQSKDPLVFDDVDCPVASRAEGLLFNSSEFRELEAQNADFLHMIGQKSGFPEFSLRRIYYLNDYLNAIASHRISDGFAFPEWANASVRAEVFRLYNLKNSFDFKLDVHKRLWSGPLFTQILHRMLNISNGTSLLATDRNGNGKNKQKFHAYSGHDLTIAGLLAILGIYPEVFPKFATAILIELHGNSTDAAHSEESSAASVSGHHFVRLFHKNETEGSQLWEYEIPDCGAAVSADARKCSLEQLKWTRRHFLIELDQWARECTAA